MNCRVTMAEWAHRVFGTLLADAQKSEQRVVQLEALTRERRERLVRVKRWMETGQWK